MNSLQSIAAYCRGELKGEVLQQFEERLESNAAFAAEVADYQRTETIGKYLNHELEGAELEAFEAQLVVDKDLAAEVMEYADDSIYEDLAINLQLLGEQVELEKTLKELSESYKKDLEGESLKVSHQQASSSTAKQKTSTSVLSRRLWFVFVAAAAVLLFFLVPRFFIQVSPETLYTENIHLNEIGDSSTKGNNSKQLYEGKKAFREKQYRAAIDTFILISPKDDEIKTCMGVAYLELNKYKDGIKTLKTIDDEIERNWYLALAYLKQNKVEQAKDHLLQIDPDSSRKPEGLLKKLEN